MSMSNEIFGFEDLPKPSTVRPKAEPILPIDDWRWQAEPSSGAPLATLSKIENTAFADAIAGENDSPENALQGFDGLAEFRKVTPLPTPVSKIAKCVGEIAKRAPERKQAIAGLLEKFKARLGGRGNLEAWDRLARSCEQYVSASILEVT
jgi:hypothetical protein